MKEINITKSRSETIAVKTRKEANLTRQNKQHNNPSFVEKRPETGEMDSTVVNPGRQSQNDKGINDCTLVTDTEYLDLL